jgi:hypothetical protein
LKGYADLEPEEEANESQDQSEGEVAKPEQTQLNELLSGWLNTIFILNLGGKANELQYKFEQHGIKDISIQIVDGNPKKSFYENMVDLIRLCKKKKLKRFAIFKDGQVLHKDFVYEFGYQVEQIKEKKKWKMLALMGEQNLVTKDIELDVEYYTHLYQDVAKVKNKMPPQRHWKSYGMREKRYANHGVFPPDHFTGVTGVLINHEIYQDVERLKNAKGRVQLYITKNYRTHEQLFATVPLLGLNGMNRQVRRRNNHNAYMYEET